MRVDGVCAGLPTSQCSEAVFSNLVHSPVVAFDNYHVIVFSDFTLNPNGGDVQGRLAVGNAFSTQGGGFDVGLKVRNAGASAIDNTMEYSFIVGANANYARGMIRPDGQNDEVTSTKEDGFVGGTFTVAVDQQNSQLPGRITGNCATAGCLNSNFAAAKSWYTKVSAAFAGYV